MDRINDSWMSRRVYQSEGRGFWGYVGKAAKVLGFAGFLGMSELACTSASAPTSAPQFGYVPSWVESPAPRELYGRELPGDDWSDMGSPDPESDAHGMQNRTELYAKALARTDGDNGAGVGIRHRARSSPRGDARWEGDFRFEALGGEIADSDGDSEGFNSQRARIAASWLWQSGGRGVKVSAGADGYWRHSDDGNGPDIRSIGPYASLGYQDRDIGFSAMISGHLLEGDWDFGSLSGEPYLQERLCGFVRQEIGDNGAYIGVEAEFKDNDYGEGSPRDKKRELDFIVGKRNVGAFSDVHVSAGPEEWEHRFSDDTSDLEIALRAELPLVEGEGCDVDLDFGVEFRGDEVGATLRISADF